MIQSIAITLLIVLFGVILTLHLLKVPHMCIFTFVKGCVIGGLYDSEDYPEEDLTEHTIQIALLFCTFTFIWESNFNNNSNNNYAG